MRTLFLLVISTSVMVVLFLNCKGDGSGARSAGPGLSADAITLQGTWRTNCLPDPSQDGYFFVDERQFNGVTFSTGFETYADDQCQKLVIAHNQVGDFDILPNEDAQTENAPARLNLAVKKIYITLHSQILVDKYNDSDFCGGDWQLAKKRQIKRSLCSGEDSVTSDDGSDEDGEDDDLIFDIAQMVSVKEEDRIYFGRRNGDSSDGKSEATRPVEIDNLKAFTRKR